MAPDAPEIELRRCDSIGELDACVTLQERVWGYEDRDIIPRRLFVVARRIGGQIFGAFPRNNNRAEGMIGFAMALPGVKEGRLYLHSHMLAVDERFRNRGIGRLLKLKQREDAVARGIRLMEWTFDPLEIKNAYLNISVLGAIVRSYTPNFYGTVSSSLQAGLETDRMHAEWWLDTDRVRQAAGGSSAASGAAAQRITTTIEIPAEVARWKATDFARAQEVQQSTRDLFLRAFETGLAVVGFTRDEHGNGKYLLGKAGE